MFHSDQALYEVVVFPTSSSENDLAVVFLAVSPTLLYPPVVATTEHSDRVITACVLSFLTSAGSISIQRRSDFRRHQPCSSSTSDVLMDQSTGCCLQLSRSLRVPRSEQPTVLELGVPRDVLVACGLARTLPWLQRIPSMSRISCHSWRCCWSVLVVGIKISQYHDAPWETCSRSHQDGTPELFVVCHVLPVFPARHSPHCC